ncbi:DUF3810 domain-containing protein [Bacillus altitudinis]|uniref:hypothetical protein n=1 Tax=Bacillus altitudinis TaxID=293387 RepID=UPI0010720C26|nr:hypothetical protein [Bacillus altitudinis]MBR0581187.1 DUF3810 domain-containing protein [Bacillus altitudinis A23-8]MBW3700539.1 hypothetical protein [Bacillus aerophilus]QEO62924.1 DUF3810 domain-containing protein [Bacillus altitudinis]
MKLKVMSLVFAAIGFLFSLSFQSMASISDVVFWQKFGFYSGAIISYIFAVASIITLIISRKQKGKILLNVMTVIISVLSILITSFLLLAWSVGM